MKDKLKLILKEINSKQKPSYNFLFKKCKEIESEILSLCNLSDDITENLYLINLNLIEIPKCPICNSNKLFIKYNKGHAKTCGNKICINKISKLNREKIMLEKYGVKNPSNIKEVQKKREKTFIDKYGVKNPFQNETVKEKIKKTNLKKFGVDNPNKNKEIRKKIEKTNLERYGVRNPTLNDFIFEKAVKNSYYYKDYKLPSGIIVKIQGFENITLDELFNNGYKEEDILINTKEISNYIGHIFYYMNGKKHKYYPDIYIISENKIIEVKSEYIFNNQKEKNLLKKEAVLNKSICFEFKIYNSKGILNENFFVEN